MDEAVNQPNGIAVLSTFFQVQYDLTNISQVYLNVLIKLMMARTKYMNLLFINTLAYGGI